MCVPTAYPCVGGLDLTLVESVRLFIGVLFLVLVVWAKYEVLYGSDTPERR